VAALEWHRIREAKLHHWLIAAILTVIGLILAHYHWMMRSRNAVYGVLQRIVSVSPFPNVVVVLIGDEEFYSRALEHRQPLKRDYVGVLVDRIAAGNPELIGIDVEMRSPDPARADALDWATETETFRGIVMRVSQQCPIVVAKALTLDEHDQWIADADVSDLMTGIRRVTRGYLNVPNDLRQIPLNLVTSVGELPSFSQAVVEAKVRRPVVVPAGDRDLPYAVFRERRFFETVQANRVRTAQLSELSEWFSHRIVLIGGDWGLHKRGDTERIDIADTPVGAIAGVYVHATYIESLLHGTMRAMPPWVKICVEVMLAAAASLLFVASRGYWRLITVVAGTLVVLLLTFFFWQNLGMFFEAFVPTVLLGVHVIGEQIIDWRDRANAAEAEEAHEKKGRGASHPAGGTYRVFHHRAGR